MSADLHHIVVRMHLTAEQIASLDRMVTSSGLGTRTAFVNSVVREIADDEMQDQAGEKAA
jgi:hypothetical protein